jgi:ribulose-bisphosphate carboxylase large chain
MSTFEITYQVTVQEDEQIQKKVEDICIEQTAELPVGVLNSEIKQKVVGKLVNTKQQADTIYEVVIAWPLADIGDEISQFLNILYGNISIQPGIRILSAEWDSLSPQLFKGPAKGISKIRSQYGISDRPLSATTLKPLGSTPDELADMAYKFAKGGIDIIKDDHGLANQDSAPFQERVKACVTTIKKAADVRGKRSYYYPNITAFSSETIDRYRKAAEFGADGVLLCPHIVGLETMHYLAQMDLDLPVIAHPAFSGTLITNPEKGLTPAFLYGQLWRALGADFVIYPNRGGRFPLTSEECQAINESAKAERLPFKRSFPMPGGGIKLENIDQWMNNYGNDCTFLIGGSLYEHPAGIEASAKEFHGKLKTAQ